MIEQVVNDLTESLMQLSTIFNCNVSEKYLEQCIAVSTGYAVNSSLWCQSMNVWIIC